MGNALQRRTEGLNTLGVRVFELSASFQFNSTSTPLLVKGTGVTVSRVSVGLYRLVWTGGFPDVLAINVTGQFATANGAGFEIAAVTPSTGTVDVRCFTVGTATLQDPAANAGNRCHVQMFVQGSGSARVI